MQILIEQFDAVNSAIFVIGVLAIYTVFSIVYLRLHEEFIKPDFNLTAFEKEFWKKFLAYLPWAMFQQGVLLTLLHLIQVDIGMKLALSIMIFGIGHIPNFRLMAFTTCFAMAFYSLWYFGGFTSFIYMAVLHAFGGTAFYKTGWDMRVWRFDKWP